MAMLDPSTPTGARGGFVGAFVRSMLRGLHSSVVGKLAVGALVVVLTAGSVLGLNVLLRGGAPKTTEAAARSSAGPERSSAPAGPRTPAPGTASAPPANKPAAVRPGVAPAPPPAARPVAAPTTSPPGRTATQASAAARQRPKAVTYTNVAGLGCTINGASYVENGFYENGDAGWWTLGYGSYTGDGCDGRFTDMPMSGNQSDTGGQNITWGFAVGGGAQSCTLSLYVPYSLSKRDVAAKSAHFAVIQGTTSGPTYTNPGGDRIVDQSRNHSRWVGLGTYPVRNGAIGVRLTNRGSTTGYDVTYPHLAGGAVRINCVEA